MSNVVAANDLKLKGISVVKKILKKGLEVIVTVRGKAKYVILSIEEFDRLRECDLLVALQESDKDIKHGRYHVESVEEHLKRVKNG